MLRAAKVRIFFHYFPLFSKFFHNFLHCSGKWLNLLKLSVNMKNLKYLRIAFLSLSVLLAGCRTGQPAQEESGPSVTEETAGSRWGFDTEGLAEEESKVRSGDFFSTILIRNGLSAQEAYNLSEACDSIFDVKSIRVGNVYRTWTSQSGQLEYLAYDIDRIKSAVFACRPPYKVYFVEKPVLTRTRTADVVIESSLWNDMIAGGASPLLTLSLADIYAWTVDFFGLQKGDRFQVIYDEKICDGEVIAVDTVRYVLFTGSGEEYPAIMFNQHDGGNIYWNEKGESMRKAFLKAPLNYTRVSSGFTYARRHPITRKVQPHTGVDYAAPAGTPVVTIGDGVVTSARNEGAGGNVIRIRHNSVYSTAYLHLSRYASGIKAGKRVKQGEVIGYVGSTGRSTGPHLDFRVWKNGTPVNPLKMDSPPAEPLKKENEAAFAETVARYHRSVAGSEADVMAERMMEML